MLGHSVVELLPIFTAGLSWRRLVFTLAVRQLISYNSHLQESASLAPPATGLSHPGATILTNSEPQAATHEVPFSRHHHR